MNIETLISTMNKENNEEIIELLKKMNIKTSAVIVNQNSNNNKIEKFMFNHKNITIINSKDKGLSKSRNELLYNANGEIGIIADDDIRYLDNCYEEIENAYNRNKNADIICFKIYKGNKPFKKYDSKRCKVGLLKSLKKSSVEITYKIKSIKEKEIEFDEDFGSGSSKYISGEENIFLSDCIKKGLKIIYEPIFIAKLEDKSNSSWFDGYNKQYFITKGAVYERIDHKLSWLYILVFSLKKYKIYKDKIRLIDVIRYMNIGRKEYQEMRNENR